MEKFNLINVLCIAAIATAITSCKKIDPKPQANSTPACTTACNNGGVVNTVCGCDCPAGYTGASCETSLSVRSVTITRIDVLNFPFSYNSGQIASYWDAGTSSSKYPDIYMNINAGTNSISTQSSSIYMNVNSVPQTYTIDDITLPSPSANYCIGMYDYDGLSADPQFMGGIYFKPIDFKKGYPKTIRLSNSAIHIDYTVYIIWNF